jgi:cell division septum initiation protein DivIVA
MASTVHAADNTSTLAADARSVSEMIEYHRGLGRELEATARLHRAKAAQLRADRNARMAALRAEGWTLHRIAQLCKVTTERVGQILGHRSTVVQDQT